MADFEPAVTVLLKHEGGWTVDIGGPTNFGWTLPALAKVGYAINATQLKTMTSEWAAALYKQYYWNGFADVNDQTVATKVFDMAVNMEDPTIGADKGEAVVLCQRAVNSVGGGLTVDGGWGPKTCAAVNAIEPSLMTQLLISYQSSFYRGLAAGNPAKFGPYLNGWLLRAQWPDVVSNNL